ncbi:MAG: Ig-like domain-containing protein, partial [Pirellulaceae bacterium]
LTAPVGNIPGLLANDSDPDLGDHVTLSGLQGASFPIGATSITGLSQRGAEVILTLTGDLTYDPTVATATDLIALVGGQNLTDSFTYSVVDDSGLSATATVEVLVQGVNKGPTTVDDSILVGVNEDTVHVVAEPGVLNNDSDPEGDAFGVTGVNGLTQLTGTTTQGAAVTLTAGGGITYNPTNASALQALSQGSSIVDTFTYTATDINGGSSDATVYITVAGINDLPVPQNDSFAVPLAPVTTGISILANDVDVDSAMTMICLIAGPNDGTLATTGTSDPGCDGFNGTLLTLNGNDVDYTPNASFSETDQFTYRIKDDFGWSTSTATVVILVNDPPTAVDDPVQDPNVSGTETLEVYQNTVNVIDVLSNDSDPDGDELVLSSVTVTTPPTNGTAIVQTVTGAVLYTPSASVTPQSTDTFSYQVQDEDGAWSNIAVVNLLILTDPTPWQNKPVAEDVDNSGEITPVDALININVINAGTYNSTNGLLPTTDPNDVPPPYYDVTGDGFLTSADALGVINWLNDNLSSANPEGEAEGEGESAARQAAVNGSLPGNFEQGRLDRNQLSRSTSDDGGAASPATTFEPAATSDWQRLSSPLGQLARVASQAGVDGGDDWGDWLDEVVDGISDARHGSDDTDIVDGLISGIFPTDS